jgi:CubicO group peptidase (beta-lactamase class C family)
LQEERPFETGWLTWITGLQVAKPPDQLLEQARYMLLLTTLLLVPMVAQSLPSSDSLDHDHVVGTLGARVDAQLTNFAAYGFSGTVLVVRDGQVVLAKGYGLADVDRRVRNTAATRFEMNSMTKMFTGVALLQLAARGDVRLSDPVARYLDGLSLDKQTATLEQLATHTSGLIVEGAALAGDSRAAFVRDVARTPLESPPGERYRYTNAGFSLLAAIIETVSGESYEDYLRRHLFAPAGMRTALFRNQAPEGDSLFAHGYVGTPKRLEPGPPNPYVWGTIGAGGVWCTVGDMYRWLVALGARRVLPEAQWRILVSPPRPPSLEAFGWHVETIGDGRLRISKGGGSDDFASQLLYYPRDRVVILWASNNLRQRWRQTLNTTLSRLILDGADAAPLPRVLALSEGTLQARAARYRSGADTFQLLAGPGYLYASANVVGIPTNVMFFPQDLLHFTAFDPSTGTRTPLWFGHGKDRLVMIELADGRRVSGVREGASPE